MGKRKYRAVPVKNVDAVRLLESAGEGRVVFGVDVAKVDFYGTLVREDGEGVLTVKWKAPAEVPEVLRLLSALGPQRVEVAMESSGTYGDAFAYQLTKAGYPVFRVQPKRTHDSAEAYDGVPSMHDAKAAAIIAKLHTDGASRRWEPRSTGERELAAAEEVAVIHDQQYRDNLNRLEAKLARHWPEVTRWLQLGSTTLLTLLLEYGSPQRVAENEEQARSLMRRAGGWLLKPEKIESVLGCAAGTTGVPMIEAERQALIALVGEIRRNAEARDRARKQLEHLVAAHPAAKAMAPEVGTITAAVLVVELGDPRSYKSADAFVKAAGLNLREVSSGTHHGALKLTKRGSSKARHYAFLATLRKIQDDPVFAAWHDKKVARDGGSVKMKSVGALMRKLLAALWHVAQGAALDSTKLFDTRKLALPQAATA